MRQNRKTTMRMITRGPRIENTVKPYEADRKASPWPRPLVATTCIAVKATTMYIATGAIKAKISQRKYYTGSNGTCTRAVDGAKSDRFYSDDSDVVRRDRTADRYQGKYALYPNHGRTFSTLPLNIMRNHVFINHEEDIAPLANECGIRK